MVDIEADADSFANGVVVMGRHQGQHLRTGREAQCVEKLRTAKGLGDDFGFHFAVVSMDYIVRAQQNIEPAVALAFGATWSAIHRHIGFESAQFHLNYLS